MKPFIFTPLNIHWEWFAARLEGPEGLDWQEDGWNCDQTHRHSRLILTRMSRLKPQDPSFNIDVEKTIDWFRQNGGKCDCEAILNIDPETKEEVFDADNF